MEMSDMDEKMEIPMKASDLMKEKPPVNRYTVEEDKDVTSSKTYTPARNHDTANKQE